MLEMHRKTNDEFKEGEYTHDIAVLRRRGTNMISHECYSPVMQAIELHYRHAKGENLLLVAPQSNPYKIVWVRKQIEMFARLGWKFVLLDLSEGSDLGPPHLLGGKWSMVELNAMANLRVPITVRVPSLSHLLETLDLIYVFKKTSRFPHVVLVHLGDVRVLTDAEKHALQSALERMRENGVWLIADRFQPLQWDRMSSFYDTQIVLAGVPNDDAWNEWVRLNHLSDVDVEDLEEDEGYFLFRGRSEGARRLLQASLREEAD
ncbi:MULTISPECIES: hypothetical protein [Alicyclobacillus]|uniref:hypothetical protein n=1 Tax=Alicyclobacillus TaxID=29330 RepID=UPI0012ED53C9|nr:MULTISPECIES: hypothetical protein [Alicyclobacillus]